MPSVYVEWPLCKINIFARAYVALSTDSKERRRGEGWGGGAWAYVCSGEGLTQFEGNAS